MSLIGLFRSARIGLVVALAGGAQLAGLPAQAEMLVEAINGANTTLPEVSSHGDWLMSCAGAGEERQCQLQTPGRVEGGVAPVSVAVVAPDAGRPVVIFRTPLETLLPGGVELWIDGRRVGRMAFQICDASGCVAPAPLEGEFGDRMRRGAELRASIRLQAGTTVGATFSLVGLIRALEALASSK